MSIEAQLAKFEKSEKFKKIVAQKNKENIQSGKGPSVDVDRWARRMTEIISEELNKYGKYGHISDALKYEETSSPAAVGADQYHVASIGFERESVFRESLRPDLFPEGVSNIAALLDVGYKKTHRPVHGEWHGKEIWSKRSREGYGFMQAAVDRFNSEAAAANAPIRAEIGEDWGK